jgi:hypothetical protein
MLFENHGVHLHSSAYLVLLATTLGSGGLAWVDALVSWTLLLASAVLVMRWLHSDRDGPALGSPWTLLIMLLALHPGHLANLQWGWQVAVFLCLLGTLVAIDRLTARQIRVRDELLALAGAGVACTSFAIGLAVVPTALALIAARVDLSSRRRLRLAAPWLLLGGALATGFHSAAEKTVPPMVDLTDLAVYALNFLGAGIARFWNGGAPIIALAGVAVAIAAIARSPRKLASPWCGLLIFASVGALLTAIGRAPLFGTDHAFVSRYVSFSSLFWLGVVGLMAMRRHDVAQSPRVGAWTVRAAALVFAMALINAQHLARKAASVATSSRELAAAICATYPAVDRGILARIYFDQPEVAADRLDRLADLSYAPFNGAACVRGA